MSTRFLDCDMESRTSLPTFSSRTPLSILQKLRHSFMWVWSRHHNPVASRRFEIVSSLATQLVVLRSLGFACMHARSDLHQKNQASCHHASLVVEGMLQRIYLSAYFPQSCATFITFPSSSFFQQLISSTMTYKPVSLARYHQVNHTVLNMILLSTFKLWFASNISIQSVCWSLVSVSLCFGQKVRFFRWALPTTEDSVSTVYQHISIHMPILQICPCCSSTSPIHYRH